MKSRTSATAVGSGAVAVALPLMLAAAACSSSAASGPATGLPDAGGTDPNEGKTSGDSLLSAEAARENAAVQSTSYTHDVKVVEATGTFDYDCSGFIDYALIRVLPAHYRELVAETSARPRAQDYVSFFTAPPADWKTVVHVTDLVPGDILAWLAAADDNGDTGHVMIVRSVPRADAAHGGAYDVDIWDSTVDLHGNDDSRRSSGTTGLGTATVVVYADANGLPTMHAWSTVSSSTDPSKVAMGRAL